MPEVPQASDWDKPLKGLVVLDLGQFLAGPSCALRLADLGADVIKVERREGGDLCRQLYVADQALGTDSLLFHLINRNKRSLAVDLKAPDDLDLVKRLIATADVLIHTFRPGAIERIGLGYETVRALNPRLVYGVVSGYGDTGPWRDKPGQDLLVQARSGMAWLSGNADQGPVPVGLSVTDLTAGAHLVQGILAALLRRATSGTGALVEVSLMASAIDLQFEQITSYLNGPREQPARSAVNNANVHATAPYGLYRTADGHIAIAMTPIARLRALLDCEALAPYVDPATAYRDRDAIKRILRDLLVTRPSRHWLDRLEPAGIWCGEVLTWPELEETEAFAALDAVQKVDRPGGTGMHTTRCPIRIDGRVLKSAVGAPALGADSDEIRAMLSEPRTRKAG